MRYPFVLLLIAPGPALAHLGHVADVAGHDHWTAAAALGAAIAAGLIGALAKGGKDKDQAADQDDAQPEGEEAPA